MSIGHIPVRAKFHHPTRKRVRDIRCRKFVLPKSGPKFTKIGDELLRTNAAYRAKFHLARSNDVREEVYKFFTPVSILAPPVPKFTNLGGDKYSKAPSVKLLGLNFVDFSDGVTDTHRH